MWLVLFSGSRGGAPPWELLLSEETMEIKIRQKKRPRAVLAKGNIGVRYDNAGWIWIEVSRVQGIESGRNNKVF